MCRRATGSLLRFLLPAIFFLACSPSVGRDAGSDEDRKLPDGAFALVDDIPLSSSLLQVRGERISAADVLFDQVLAEEARHRFPHRARAIERAVLSRAWLTDVRRHVLDQAPPTQQALEAQRARNWMRFDRPRAVRSVSVFVPIAELAPEHGPRAFIEELHHAARGQPDLDSLSQALARIEKAYDFYPKRMPPVAADGRVVPIATGDQAVETVWLEYARVVARLEAPGAVTELVSLESGFVFGWAEEIIPARIVPVNEALDQLRKEIAAPAVAQRSEALIQAEKPGVRWGSKDLGSLLGTVWRRK